MNRRIAKSWLLSNHRPVGPGSCCHGRFYCVKLIHFPGLYTTAPYQNPQKPAHLIPTGFNLFVSVKYKLLRAAVIVFICFITRSTHKFWQSSIEGPLYLILEQQSWQKSEFWLQYEQRYITLYWVLLFYYRFESNVEIDIFV